MKRAPLLLLLLSGCAAVGPDYEAPKAPEVTAELFAGSGYETESLANWWRDFQDPLLCDLIEEGLKNAPTVEAAVANLRAQRALRESTEAGFWPQFTASGSYTWGRAWGAQRQGWEDNLTARGDASWEIDIFGGVRRSVEQEMATEARLAYTLQDVRVTLAAEIATAYVELRRYAAQVDIAEANLALQEKTASVIRERALVGMVPWYDVAAAEAQTATTRASIPSLRQNLTAAQLRLDWLTGQAPYATQARLRESLDEMTLPDLSPKVLPNELLRRRADIRIAEENVHAQTAAVGVATAELYPRFSLGGNIGLSTPDLTPWSDYTQSLNFGPSVSWNIFGFGTWRKRVESAKATLDAQIATYEDTVLEAYQEAEAAWDACRREAERTNDLRAAESFSAEALRIADQLYENGEITIDDVLTRQSSLLSAQEALVSHRATLFTNAITLYRALGGGWTDEPPPDSATTDENGAPITEEAPAAEQADLAAAEPTPAPTPDAPDAP